MWKGCTAVAAAAVVLSSGMGIAPMEVRADEPHRLAEPFAKAVTRSLQYLATEGQAADGSFSSQYGPAVTALVGTAAMRHGRPANDPMVAKCIAYVKKHVQADGGIYPDGSRMQNYETCAAILLFVEANKNGEYDELLAKAEAFVKGLQWTGEEGHDIESPYYGGAGYGKHGRPDLSNTTFLLDALQALGRDENDEAVKRALVFVSRSQNLETEHNTMPWAAKVEDGGFIYTPANGGESQAGELPDGGLRSYASMTYAGLKSMIFAGVGPEDPRVKAAFEWAQRHYTLESNPGLGQQGLYYYYHTFAKALDAMGSESITAATGSEHKWREELITELVRRQRPDGSWANDNPRWLESDKNLSTAYALLGLVYCRPAVE